MQRASGWLMGKLKIVGACALAMAVVHCEDDTVTSSDAGCEGGTCVAQDLGPAWDLPPWTDGPDCPNVTVDLEPVISHVMLLIDRSGSMVEPFGEIDGQSVSRWAAEQHALTDAAQGVVTELQTTVRFGAALYHSNLGFEGGPCPILTFSAGDPPGQPVLDNREAIHRLMEDNAPTGDTPTGEALGALVSEMQQWDTDPAAEPGPRVIILSTDGAPDVCQDPEAHDEVAEQLSEAAVQAAYAAGISTYVLSVGPGVNEAHLAKLANAGAGLPLEPPSASYYQANDPQQMVQAFRDIIRGVRICTFTLDGKVEPQYQNSGTVTFNGQALTQGTDWELTDPSTIELLGQACQDFLNANMVTLQAQFPCGAVIE